MKVRAHQRYKNKDGKVVVGVTTITGMLGLNKRVLVNWANRMGLKGIDSSKYKDETAEIGTLGHEMITNSLIGKTTNTDDYSKNQIDKAENSALSFWNWHKKHEVEVHFVEKQLVSEQLQFGGTCDIYATVDGHKELIDLKTGKDIYIEHFIQTSAYRQLLRENGFEVEEVRILNIPRTKNENFREEVREDTEKYFQIFVHLLGIKKLLKEV